MADRILITKGGFIPYQSRYRIFAECVQNGTFLHDIRIPCEIAPKVTLLDVFGAVDGDPLLKALIATYSQNKRIDELHKAAILKPGPAKPFISLRITQTFNLGRYGITPSTALSAVSHSKKSCSVRSVPIDQISRLRLSLDDEATILFGSTKKPMRKMPYSFSLLEVLDAIYYEISFNSPTEKKKARTNDVGILSAPLAMPGRANSLW